MLTCMIFVFSCILEFIVATVFKRIGKKNSGDKVRSLSLTVKAKISIILNLAMASTHLHRILFSHNFGCLQTFLQDYIWHVIAVLQQQAA